MATNTYNRARDTALKQFKKKGTTMIIKRRSARTDTSSPWKDPDITPTSFPCYGIITNYKSQEIDGEAIRRDDKKVKIAAKGLEIVPQATDTLSIGNTDYSIIDVTPVAPDGEPIIYIVQARNV